MDPVSAMKALEIFGPYALVVFISIAYWNKDKQLIREMNKGQEFTKKLMLMIENKTASDTKLESALVALKEVIMIVVNKVT